LRGILRTSALPVQQRGCRYEPFRVRCYYDSNALHDVAERALLSVNPSPAIGGRCLRP
jgi:hypothetical protein